MEDIRVLLRICREQKQWSQETLAKAIGVERSEVSRYEHGQKRIDLDTLERWAQVTDGGDILGWAIAERLGASEEGRWQRVLQYEQAREQLRVILA